MAPDRADFDEWLGHPVTEWVFTMCARHADAMRDKWAAQVWQSGEVSPEALLEARVRADCYRALPESSFDDWRVIDGSEA
jgi:hypothetical protein